MNHPTPDRLRLAIVRLFNEEGRTYAEIAELLDVGEATVSRVLRRYRETGGVAPNAPGGGNFSPIKGKIAEALRRLVQATPDATVAELTAALVKSEGIATSVSSVKRALPRLGLSRKKRVS